MIPKSRLPLFMIPLLGACAAQSGVHSTAPAGSPVKVGIVAINDFHGALEPPKISVPVTDGKGGITLVPAGGSAYLASAVDTVRSEYTHSLTVAAGDLIGASQLSSSLFLDEPAIGALNRMGLEFNAVGNHEFDRGRDELKRKATGGCQRYTALTPCRIEPFKGARFTYLAANSIEANGKTLFPASAIRSFGSGRNRVKIGLIGLTLKETADLASREGLKGVHFTDEADTINAIVPRLKAQGAAAIVVLIHQGGYTKGGPDPSTCPELTGGIRPILDRLDNRVDVVISGHTHWNYVCDYGQYNPAKPFLLTSAGVFGQMVTDVTLEIEPARRAVVSKRARNVIVQSEAYSNARGPVPNTDRFPRFAPRADVAAYIGKYVAASKQEILRPVGQLGGEAARPGGEASWAGGSLGNLIADAQLAATRKAGAQIAFMNPFGIRSPAVLVPAADGTITFGQIYAVQPFTNGLVTMSLTGAQLKQAIEEGFDDNQPKQLLSPSQGFSYTYDLTRPVGSRVVSMALDGRPIDPAQTYRVTVNSFLANGGDSFATFATQRDVAIAPVTDIEALEAWLSGASLRPAPSEERASEAKK